MTDFAPSELSDLSDLPTPALLLDRGRMRANLSRLARRISALGCTLRPHTKTHKSRDVLADVQAISNNHGIAVSTLREARYFFEGGQSDVLYAVGMTPSKVAEAAALIRAGCDLKVITDNAAMVELLAQGARTQAVDLPVLIELDVDGHRSGVCPTSDTLLDVARAIADAEHLTLAGVMTHAGGSYDCRSLDALKVHAETERALTVEAADRIRAAGLDCPIVSIGSTPTASVVDDLTGVTEVRSGVYTFFDLFQAGLGVADMDDIAISVLTTVIGHQAQKGWVIVDGGWMALSRDRGTASQAVDQGYGVLCTLDGAPLGDVILGGANQEHGIIQARAGGQALDVTRFPVGSKWRVLPNHACATAAQYDRYHIVGDGRVTARWTRINGW